MVLVRSLASSKHSVSSNEWSRALLKLVSEAESLSTVIGELGLGQWLSNAFRDTFYFGGEYGFAC